MPPRRRRRHPTSPPATPLDDEDLLAEFLLRLPPRPSSLPRAAAVCEAWRRVVTDPHFLRRYRAHHRKPPLLGFFNGDGSFVPTLEAPDRVPTARLSVSFSMLGWKVVGCRGGLVLCRSRQRSKLQVLDPMTGRRSAVITRQDKLPIPLNVELVVHSTGVEVDLPRFRLFALSRDADCTELSVSVYSSDSGAWAQGLVHQLPYRFKSGPSTLVGNAFYWPQTKSRFLKYDLETQKLSIIKAPLNNEGGYEYNYGFRIMTKYGLVTIVDSDVEKKFTIQIWVTEILSGVAMWVLHKHKVVKPDMCVPVWTSTAILGFEEENSVVFISFYTGLFMLNLESMKFTRVSKKRNFGYICPYSSFVTADA